MYFVIACKDFPISFLNIYYLRCDHSHLLIIMIIMNGNRNRPVHFRKLSGWNRVVKSLRISTKIDV
ncbi:hypothetical protein KsCSTR_29290 [Candidatus Kuenenia stuttgartiensis]|uniref:Uncharacterized protein n=1 Tax=Kuenenia stuttgartiensis TaxID=174633 RepID=Q1Q5T0_KUEST|nr:hypothetical protein KsCSTR_29290 [Candidatus Kuenenia stuttgartiensis]CAJ75369.1 unknown protein [Candidatus Kuenenia stuttgartiensis]